MISFLQHFLYFICNRHGLALQRRLQTERQVELPNYLESKKSSANHVRDILDGVSPEVVRPVFDRLLRMFDIKRFLYHEMLLVAIDGDNTTHLIVLAANTANVKN
jgi:hypothetical protein